MNTQIDITNQSTSENSVTTILEGANTSNNKKFYIY